MKQSADLHIPQNPNKPGIKYNTSTFPSGEGYVKILEPGRVPPTINIYYRWTGDASLILLLNITNALRLMGATTIRLFCPYFPGVRSDRVGAKNMGEALSSKVYAEVVNTQRYEEVIIFDPHSDVTPAVLERVRVVSNYDFVANALRSRTGDYFLISPDAGANKKVEGLAEFLTATLENKPTSVIRADKKRDMSTGKLVPGQCIIYAAPDQLKGKACVIVDDICSKGGTFMALAKELKATHGVGDITLVVSHYEGVADPEALSAAGISTVHTTTSLIEPTIPGNLVTTHGIIPFLQ